MASKVIELREDAQFEQELTKAGSKLVVVDFYATWCGPCQRIAPVFKAFSVKYTNAVFLKVDVDQCGETAGAYGVTAMPTFLLFKEKNKIDSQRGADPNALEAKIKQHYEEAAGGDQGGEDSPVKGHSDLGTLISMAGCECLNEADDHPLAHALTSKGGYLESDCDEQLIINVTFNQPVKLHSMIMQAPAENGPKTVKVFQNLPLSLDFDKAESMEPTQLLELKPEDLKEGAIIPLRFVKFQNVLNVTLFIKDNQTGTETTQMDYLTFIGSPIGSTNMQDFKRVAGKKGETH